VCHTGGLGHFTFKNYLKAKEELWKLKYFTIAKIYLIFPQKKNPLKEIKNPSRHYKSITNLSSFILGPCHFTFKKYLKTKEELWKLKYFTIAKNIIFQKTKKILSKKSKSFKTL